MSRFQKIQLGIIDAVGIIVIIMLITLFKGSSSNLKQLLEAKDAIIKAKDETIAAKNQQNEKLDSASNIIRTRDSIIAANYLQNQKIYTRYDEQLKNIPDRIAVIANNDDSIRAAFARP